jgi:cysteine synthase B
MRKLWHSVTYDPPTLDEVIGKTPLVRLQRLGSGDCSARGNVILGKLEGNIPAG